MKIVKINDIYIDQLRRIFPHIMFNKNNGGLYGRKYIGVLFKINNLNYYAPLSSPKYNDFIDKNNCEHIIKIYQFKHNRKRIIGKIMLNCMIPVPKKFVETLTISEISNFKYKDLLINEINFINRNQKYIINKAKQLYFIKNERNISNKKLIKLLLPYKEIENYILKHYKILDI